MIPNPWAFSSMTILKRVLATPLTEEWLQKLTTRHGPLLFYQSGGCCEGSAPMCFRRDDYRIGQNDVFLGNIGTTPFYISASQFEYWRHTQLLIDVIQGGGNAFSIESPEGISFHTRSQIFTDEEMKILASQGEPPRGPQE